MFASSHQTKTPHARSSGARRLRSVGSEVEKSFRAEMSSARRASGEESRWAGFWGSKKVAVESPNFLGGWGFICLGTKQLLSILLLIFWFLGADFVDPWPIF